MKNTKVKRTEQIWLHPDKTLSWLCHISKSLYNQANYIIKQNIDSDNPDRKWVRYGDLDKMLKQEGEESENYTALPAQTAQQILKLVDKAWLSFFRAIKEWKKSPEKFKEKPNPPRYKKKNGEHILVFTNQQCKIEEGVVKFPKKMGIEVKTRLPDDTNLREVRILPQGVGYVCEIVYEKEVEIKEKRNKEEQRVVGIDLGAKNIITMCNNIGKKPIVVRDDGTGIKSINQFYHKRKAELQSIYDRQGIKYGDKMRRLELKRGKKVHDYLHKLSRFIVDWCVEHEIGTIFFGYNEGWKQNVNIGRRNNQTFTQIPFMEIIHKTAYKAEEKGIKVKEQEESHTSKCSFLDNEPIEQREEYVGKRKTRSFFRSASGKIIHADVNAGYNIIEKANPGAIPLRIREWIGGCGLHPVRCYF